MKGIIYGVGVNDADYVVQPRVNGVKKDCKIYSVWTSMLERCFSDRFAEKNKAYIGCSVCNEWLSFMNFRKWMIDQNWQSNQLDKDLLCNGNKIYSPSTCLFVSRQVNNFIRDNAHIRGEYMIGVSFHKPLNKFRSQCANTIKGKNEHIGYFEREIDAHLAWKKRKHELACQLADMQTDARVANALRTRYL